MSSKKLLCAIVTRDTNWLVDTLFSVPYTTFCEINPMQLGSKLPNPYGLEYSEEPDIIVVDTSFFGWLKNTNKEHTIGTVLSSLRKMSKYKAIVGTEGTDWIHLSKSPEVYEGLDIIIKAQGIYKDADMYNYEIGSCSTNKDWLAKKYPIPNRYSEETLSKLRLSFPCFLSINKRIRNKSRSLKKSISPIGKSMRKFGDIISDLECSVLRKINSRPAKDLHFVGGLTHIQRLDMLMLLREYFSDNNTLKITNIEEYIWGMAHGRNPTPPETIQYLNKAVSENNLFSMKRLNRNSFKRTLFNHKIILTPTGFGELTFRHGEGWNSKRVVLSQNLSHINMMYPCVDNENVVFCKSDFSNLDRVIKQLLNDEIYRRNIADRGFQVWDEWNSGLKQVLYDGFSKHVYALLNLKN